MALTDRKKKLQGIDTFSQVDFDNLQGQTEMNLPAVGSVPPNMLPNRADGAPQGALFNPKLGYVPPAPRQGIGTLQANNSTYPPIETQAPAVQPAPPMATAVAKTPAINAPVGPQSGGSMSIQGGGKATVDAQGNITKDAAWKNTTGIGGSVTAMPGEVHTRFDKGPGDDQWSQLEDGTALGAAKAGIARKLGYVPVDYADNRMKYDMAVVNQGAQYQKNTLDSEAEKGKLAIDAPYKQGLIANQAEQVKGAGALNAAHANYYNAEASFKQATSSPWYLQRQERIALIKDKAERDKEEKKLDYELGKNWVKGVVGADPTPKEMNTAMAYMSQQSDFERKFDELTSKLPPRNQQFWVQGLAAKDPSVMAELAKRGIIPPQEPTFTPRIPGVAAEEK